MVLILSKGFSSNRAFRRLYARTGAYNSQIVKNPKIIKGLLIPNICVISVTCYTYRPYGVHPVSAGQFPVRWGAGGAQCGATLHCIRIPKPNHPMAEGWSAVTRRLPLDAAHHRPHRFWLEARGQWQLHLWGHQQLRLQRGDRSPQRHRWVKIWRVYSTVIKYLYLIPMTTPLSTQQSNTLSTSPDLHCSTLTTTDGAK